MSDEEGQDSPGDAGGDPGTGRGGDAGSRTRLVRHSGAAGIAGAFAVVSGVVFDAVIAFSFGAGSQSDAYFIAARIPLGIQAVLTVASNQVLVPLISNWRGEAPGHETNRRTSLLATAAGLAGLVIAILGAAAAWWLMRITAPGSSVQEIDLAASAARIMFFVVPLEAVAGVFEAYLNAGYSFVVPSGAKTVRNLVAAGVVVFAPGSGEDPAVIAWGYLAGMAVLVAVVIAWAMVRRFRYVASLQLRDPHVLDAARLSARPLAGAAVNPAARLVEQQLVSFLPAGMITITQYAYRLISAVGGTVFFRSVMVALLPRLTEATSRGNMRRVTGLTRTGVNIMVAISVPLAAVVAVLARPAVVAVFERGEFSATDAALLGWVLVAYAASLPGSGVQRALLAPFFAKLDTSTPLRNTLYGNAANLLILGGLIVLAGESNDMAVVSVGIAYSVAQYVHVGHAWWRMHHGLQMRLEGTVRFTLEVVAGSLVLAAVLFAAAWALDLYADLPRWQLLFRTALAGAAGLVPVMGMFVYMRRRLRRPDAGA